MTDIASTISVKGITEIVHFSTNLGLLGCLHTGYLLPRSRLPENQSLAHILTLNAPFRAEERPSFDKSERWIDYVNMSVSEITTNLFKHSLKWHADRDIYWVILSFDPELCSDDGVYFSTTNNIYPGTIRGKGGEALEALFANRIHRRDDWYANRRNRAAHLPTCEQAEVLYPAKVDMRFLRRVYVREGEEADSVYALLSQYSRQDVAVVLDPEKFKGQSN